MAKQNLLDTMLFRAIEQSRSKKERQQLWEQQATLNAMNQITMLERQAQKDKMYADMRRAELDMTLRNQMQVQGLKHQGEITQMGLKNIEARLQATAAQDRALALQRQIDDAKADRIVIKSVEERKTQGEKSEQEFNQAEMEQEFISGRQTQAETATANLEDKRIAAQAARQRLDLAHKSKDRDKIILAEKELATANFIFDIDKAHLSQRFTQDNMKLEAYQEQEAETRKQYYAKELIDHEEEYKREARIFETEAATRFEELQEKHRREGRADTAEAAKELETLKGVIQTERDKKKNEYDVGLEQMKNKHSKSMRIMLEAHDERKMLNTKIGEEFESYGFSGKAKSFEDVEKLLPDDATDTARQYAKAGFQKGAMKAAAQKVKDDAQMARVIAKATGEEADDPYETLRKAFLEIIKGGIGGILADPSLSKEKSKWLRDIAGVLITVGRREKLDINVLEDMLYTLNLQDMPVSVGGEANKKFIETLLEEVYPETYDRLKRSNSLFGTTDLSGAFVQNYGVANPNIELPGAGTKVQTRIQPQAAPTPTPTSTPTQPMPSEAFLKEVNKNFQKKKYYEKLVKGGMSPMEAANKLYSLFTFRNTP